MITAYQLEELETMIDYNRRRVQRQAALIAEAALKETPADTLLGYMAVLQQHILEVTKLEIQLETMKNC